MKIYFHILNQHKLKPLLIFTSLLSISLLSSAQSAVKKDSLYHMQTGEQIYLERNVDTLAEYIGGEYAMFNFIFKHIKYPDDARKKQTEGMVYSSFIVEKDGSISDPKIIQSLSKACDMEVMKMLSEMPKNWKPAYKNGAPVRMQFILPVIFKLDASAKRNK